MEMWGTNLQNGVPSCQLKVASQSNGQISNCFQCLNKRVQTRGLLLKISQDLIAFFSQIILLLDQFLHQTGSLSNHFQELIHICKHLDVFTSYCLHGYVLFHWYKCRRRKGLRKQRFKGILVLIKVSCRRFVKLHQRPV